MRLSQCPNVTCKRFIEEANQSRKNIKEYLTRPAGRGVVPVNQRTTLKIYINRIHRFPQ